MNLTKIINPAKAMTPSMTKTLKNEMIKKSDIAEAAIEIDKRDKI